MAVIGVNSEQLGKQRSITASRSQRCLFGRPTDVELRVAMEEWSEHERMIDDEKRRQWNFDFRRGTPLPGRWQWERVCPAAADTPPSSSVGPTPHVGAPSTADVAPSPVSSCATPAPETVTSPQQTSSSQQHSPLRRRRRRQTTLPGSHSGFCHDRYSLSSTAKTCTYRANKAFVIYSFNHLYLPIMVDSSR